MRFLLAITQPTRRRARLLVIELVEVGIDVWFDQWEIKPGDSILRGIETGLSGSNTFALLWSEKAAASRWVGTELKAALKRRIEDPRFRLIPVMIDEVPLPLLVADFRGFGLQRLSDPEEDSEGDCRKRYSGNSR
jgi:hypothetical protein